MEKGSSKKLPIGEIFKWGVVIVVVLVAWRFVSGLVGSFSGSVSTLNSGYADYAPTQYALGVYGPSVPYYGSNPFYSSPSGGGKRWNRPRPQ